MCLWLQRCESLPETGQPIVPSCRLLPLLLGPSFSISQLHRMSPSLLHKFGFQFPLTAVWWLGIVFSVITLALAFSIPDPRDVYIDYNDEVADPRNAVRRIHCSSRSSRWYSDG